ncbi:MAG: hypothetical protein GX781_09530, partial [Clostridiales bacterium]|nr:hypothetical protein [Clostridiales bacterium]
MQNHSVAIYSRSGYTSYARLAASSPKYGGKLSKSLDVAQFPLMKSRLDRGECFTNTSLEPGYPAFSAPVMHDNRAIAMIALWEVPFDQQTLYHQNLFKVVAGLVQSAMVRTLLYFNYSKDMYLMNTHIMTAKSFQSALDIYLRMKKQRISDYTLLRVSSMAEDISLSEIDQKISNVIRSTDHIGLWEDETCFVLLPQAVTADIPKIENRLMEAGFSCEVVLSEAVYE